MSETGDEIEGPKRDLWRRLLGSFSRRVVRQKEEETPLQLKHVGELITYGPEQQDNPYSPDLGPMPRIGSLIELQEVDLDKVADGTAVGIQNFKSYAYVYTLFVFDNTDGERYLRMWRRLPKDLNETYEGQGLFIKLDDFKKEQIRISRELPVLKKDVVLYLPYFWEGEGEHNMIGPPNLERDIERVPINKMFVYLTEEDDRNESVLKSHL